MGTEIFFPFLLGGSGKCSYLCIRNSEETVANRNVAQLVAHYVRDVGVGRSSRLIPTQRRRLKQFSLRLCFFPLCWRLTSEACAGLFLDSTFILF